MSRTKTTRRKKAPPKKTTASTVKAVSYESLDAVLYENINVRLEPHKARRLVFGKWVEVELPQSVIFVNDVWSGYVANKPGSHISLLDSSLPADVVQIIKHKVDEMRGNVSSAVAQAKAIQENQVVVETEGASNTLADENI